MSRRYCPPLALLALAAAVVGCGEGSATSPAGDAQLTRVCARLALAPSAMDECTIRLTSPSGATIAINGVTLLGHGGQPVSAGFAYGNGLGLRFYSDPTPDALSGLVVGPGPFEFVVRAVLSTGEAETDPPPGTYPAAVRLSVTPTGGSARTLEVAVNIVVSS